MGKSESNASLVIYADINYARNTLFITTDLRNWGTLLLKLLQVFCGLRGAATNNE